MKDNWWNKIARKEIEKFGECNNLQGLYSALKPVYSPKANTVTPIKNADETQLFTDVNGNIRQIERAFLPTAKAT